MLYADYTLKVLRLWRCINHVLTYLLMLWCRFINARRRIVQPAAAAAAAAADTASDNHESSAAKRMKTMLQREARSQFWTAPLHATSVGYSSQTAETAVAADEVHSLSSAPSSTVSYPTAACACVRV